jgi:ABC-type multidrug transport system fused ATPase/permease subunit
VAETTAGGRLDASPYLHIYVALNMASVLFNTCRGGCLARARINASRNLHAGMLKRVLAAPVYWFDSTPMGRVLNRFSRETSVIDTDLPMTVGQLIGTYSQVIGTLVTIAVSTSGLLLLPMLPLMALYHWLQTFYLRTSTELQRLESIARSPLFSRFTLVLTGTSTVRAFSCQQRPSH